MSSYVYRFIDGNNKVIYYGKTTSMDNRMGQHFGGKGHLSNECYKNVCKIEYQKYKTESDSLIMETYYITKYDPEYNKLQKSKDTPTIELDEGNWKTYRVIKPVHEKDNVKTSWIWKLVALVYIGLLIYFVINWLGNIF